MNDATATSSTPRWSPALVEDLLFRQFIKNEDVSALLPPAPSVSDESYLDEYEQASRMLFAYVRNGPVSALAAHNVNTAMSNNNSSNNAAVGKSAYYASNNSSSNSNASKALLSRTPPPPSSSAAAANSNSSNSSKATQDTMLYTAATAAGIVSSSSSSLPPSSATAATSMLPPQASSSHATAMRTPTPKPQPSSSSSAVVASNNSGSTMAAAATALSSSCLSPLLSRLRRGKVEWPHDVPSNNALKSNSRSKVAHLTAQRVAAQGSVDPDLIFAQDTSELPLHTIFARYPNVLQTLAATRNASGDWRNDTFTHDEEALYKREMGYTHIGPSQCTHTGTAA